MTLRRKLCAEEQAEANNQDKQEQTAHKLREIVERFRTTFALRALHDRLPLRFPSYNPEAFVFRALSWYTPLDWERLTTLK